MKRTIAISTMLIALLIAVLIVVYDFTNQIYKRTLNITEDTTFSIQIGDTVTQILTNLHDEQLLEPYREILPLRWHIRLYASLNETTLEQIQAGEYLLEPRMKFHQLLDKVFVGQVVQRKFSIIEGYTMRQILNAMKATSDINIVTTDYQEISRLLGIPQASPEGWIFPDTYYYTADSDSISLLKRGYLKMQSALEEAWQTRDPRISLNSPYEVLILASIVEKESAKEEERPQVAGVFISRLKKKMLLQADPTVIYGLGSRFDGDLRSLHLREEQAYNSYIHKGLPPTPIAMPSFSSIAAVLHPEFSDYLYFVAKEDGSHYFSKTYEEHLKAVNKYQLKR